MALFINLEPSSTLAPLDSNILYSIALALTVSLIGIILTMIDNQLIWNASGSNEGVKNE